MVHSYLRDKYKPSKTRTHLLEVSIKTKLLQEVKDDLQQSVNKDTALQVKRRDPQKGTKGPRCYNCNKYSHLARDGHSRHK